MSLHLAEGAVRSRHLSEGAVGVEHLAAEAVGEAHLQAQAVTSEKLANRSVTADHLCVESVDGLHIKQETISGYHLVPGTISFIHLEPSLQALLNRRSAEEAQDDAAHTAVDPEQFDSIGETEDPGIQSEIETPEAEEAEISLESGTELVAELEPELAEVHISTLNLLLDAVTAQISEADVTAGGQLQPESVRSEHLAAGAVTPEHLSFQPVQTVGVRTTVQQFGMSPFLLKLEDELTEVVLIFDRPFADNNYVLVASTDQTNTYAVIQQKEPDGAIIEVVRSKFSPELQGVVNWIAIGAANE
ncbi:hypothetical protein C8Z91_29525 [Paenibacillus elgii]|uniref:WIAG-tail domain n=2 Tax=Paenibacillus elgii TaxID=189691 RepID=A0A2T6FV53_9BACL|nr:hypothetical protein C8Z91_29525 [Paenibacillus elgii]